MNRIRYILDLSNITPPKNTAGDLTRAYDAAAAAKKKKRAAKITLAAAAALLALALSAAVFFIAKRNGQNEKPNDPAPSFTGIPVIGFDPDSVGLTEFVMTYTDLASQSLVIPFNRTDELYGYFGDEKKYAEITDMQIARTLYFGADGFSFAELYSGPLSRVSDLPDGMRTLTLGACRRGTFIYLLTLGVHVVPISLPDADADGAAPCARLEDADVGDAGELYFNGTSYYARFSDGFPWKSSLRIFKIRYEHNNAVIYDVTEPETVPIDGVYRCRTDGGVFEFTADPSLLSPKGYGGRLCDYPITADLCREEFSPGIIRLIINKYGLEWFVPAAVTDTGRGAKAFIGKGVKYDPEKGFYDFMTQEPVDVYYDPSADTPFFGENLASGSTYAVAPVSAAGEVSVPYTVDPVSVLRTGTGFFPGLKINAEESTEYAYPVYRNGNDDADYPFIPYSKAIHMITGECADSDVGKLCGSEPGSYQRPLSADFRINAEFIPDTRTVRIYGNKSGKYGAVSPGYRINELLGYEVHGLYLTDFSGCICGLHLPEYDLLSISDGGASRLYTVTNSDNELVYVYYSYLPDGTGMMPYEETGGIPADFFRLGVLPGKRPCCIISISSPPAPSPDDVRCVYVTYALFEAGRPFPAAVGGCAAFSEDGSVFCERYRCVNAAYTVPNGNPVRTATYVCSLKDGVLSFVGGGAALYE